MFLKGNEHVNTVLRDLDRYHIYPPPEVRQDGKHVKITWQISGCPRRTAVTSKTPSDWRTLLNFRAQVRRVLREDKVLLKTPAERQASTAIAINPTPPEPFADRLARLEAELEALTDIVLEKVAAVPASFPKELTIVAPKTRPSIAPIRAPTPAPPAPKWAPLQALKTKLAAEPKVAAPAPKLAAKSNGAHKPGAVGEHILSFLQYDAPVTVADLAWLVEKSKNLTQSHLAYLAKKGLAAKLDKRGWIRIR